MNKTLRFTVLNRDNFTCQYCGKKPPEVRLEIDHIHPRSQQGKDTLDNLITACFECNNGKSDKKLLRDIIKIKIGRDFELDGIGQICRKCNLPTVHLKRIRLSNKLFTQPYYFTAYDKCQKCGTMYMIESCKILNRL